MAILYCLLFFSSQLTVTPYFSLSRAFGAVETAESAWVLAGHNPLNKDNAASVQQVLSCGGLVRDVCLGAQIETAMDYIVQESAESRRFSTARRTMQKPAPAAGD